MTTRCVALDSDRGEGNVWVAECRADLSPPLLTFRSLSHIHGSSLYPFYLAEEGRGEGEGDHVGYWAECKGTAVVSNAKSLRRPSNGRSRHDGCATDLPGRGRSRVTNTTTQSRSTRTADTADIAGKSNVPSSTWRLPLRSSKHQVPRRVIGAVGNIRCRAA